MKKCENILLCWNCLPKLEISVRKIINLSNPGNLSEDSEWFGKKQYCHSENTISKLFNPETGSWSCGASHESCAFP